MLATSKTRHSLGTLPGLSSVVFGNVSRVRPGSGVQSFFSLDQQQEMWFCLDLTVL